MRLRSFSLRVAREILRDPLTVGFGLGFPVVLLLLLSAIQANIPVELFAIHRLAPGVSVFGLSFLTLFSALLVAKDRSSALLQRLYTTPMTPADFILGYLLPVLPMGLAQAVVTYGLAGVLGLEMTIHVAASVLLMLPVALLQTALGILCGSLLTDKQVGGVCGALLTNLSAWLSGIWFDLKLVGGVFEDVANVLPFVHSVELQRAAVMGDYIGAVQHLWWVLGYGAVLLLLAIWAFLRQMKQ